MKKNISVFSMLMMFCAFPAMAGWQYDGYRARDGYYKDDGSRFTIGFRGGLSIADAKMKNEIGSLYARYWINDETGEVIPNLAYTNMGNPEGYTFAGYGDLANLPLREDFKKKAFAAGASVGFTLPNYPQWRLEATYDYIAETEYNQTPLLEGSLTLSNGYIVDVRSTAAQSTITTDIVSAMVYYDFFDGKEKRLSQFIPYVGFGLGYAISRTTLHLSDLYGDLSDGGDLDDYGTVNSIDGVLRFDNPSDRNKYPASTNIAVSGALGFSYGIAESTFLDVGVRLMYVPKITWSIANSDGSKSREWFGAENMIYTNVMLGLRFEF